MRIAGNATLLLTDLKKDHESIRITEPGNQPRILETSIYRHAEKPYQFLEGKKQEA